MFQEDPAGPPSTPLPPSPASPPLEDWARWRGRDLLAGLVLLFLGVAGVIAVLVAATRGAGPADEDGGIPFVAVLATLVFEVWMGALVLLLARARGISLRDLGFRRPRNWAFLGYAVAGAYGTLIAYGMGLLAFQEVTGRDLSHLMEGNQIPFPEQNTLLIWVTIGLAVTVAAPLSEELFFRGLLFRGLSGRWGIAAAMIVSGVAFSLVHFNASVIVPFAVIGMIFAWAYRSTGSLWTPIAAHAIVNSISFVVTVIRAYS